MFNLMTHFTRTAVNRLYMAQIIQTRPGCQPVFPLLRLPSPVELLVLDCIEEELKLKPPAHLSFTLPSVCHATAGLSAHVVIATHETFLCGAKAE